MGPNSFQWWPATGQGAMGTKWSIGSSVWTWGRISSLWRWWSTGIGCPGRLWSLLLWRYSRPAWTRSFAACCRWTCFGRRLGPDDPQRSLPTPTILWFCDVYLVKFEEVLHFTLRRYIRLLNINETKGGEESLDSLVGNHTFSPMTMFLYGQKAHETQTSEDEGMTNCSLAWQMEETPGWSQSALEFQENSGKPPYKTDLQAS